MYSFIAQVRIITQPFQLLKHIEYVITEKAPTLAPSDPK